MLAHEFNTEDAPLDDVYENSPVPNLWSIFFGGMIIDEARRMLNNIVLLYLVLERMDTRVHGFRVKHENV